MSDPVETARTGIDAIETASTILRHVRATDPHGGLYDAAEVQWWWAQRERPTDEIDQLCWLDASGRPVAATLLTDVGDRGVQLDTFLAPDAPDALLERSFRRTLEHASANGIDRVILEADRDDADVRRLLDRLGFERVDDGVLECWLDAVDRPPTSPLADDYRLTDRAHAARDGLAHHMIHERRGHTDPEPRLRESSLYRPDLDLVVHDVHDDGAVDQAVAAYALCWFDPGTKVGVVEPMRTEDAHQGRGLARHLLTTGVERLAEAGAERVKICVEPDNAPAVHLYTDAGFVPQRRTDVFAGPTAAAV